MKKLLFAALLSCCSVSFAFCQQDTAMATLHADDKTTYMDENGATIDAGQFMHAMGGGGYTMQPVVADGRIKSLQLKKTGNKITPGAEAPDFTVKDISGHTFSLKGLRGKTVVLNFWFTNCPGCVKEMPALNKLAGKYKNNPKVVFLAITFDGKQKVRDFLLKHSSRYNVVADQASLVQGYGIAAFPFSIVIDPSGRIAFSDNAALPDVAEQLDQVISMVTK